MSDGYTPLRVVEARDEIGGLAKTLVFDVPPHLSSLFSWRAGQHVGVRFHVGGEEIRRSYSISSCYEAGDPLRITVKRVRGGVASNHVGDHVGVGDVVEVSPPAGSFVLEPREDGYRTCYFFAAGSGITPIHAMIRALMAREPHSSAHLVYGNIKRASALLLGELEELARLHPKRLTIAHVFSEWGSSWSRGVWRTGRVDDACVGAALDAFPPYAQDARYFVCGPGDMNATVRAALTARDVPAERIHSENYGGAVSVDEGPSGVKADLTVRVRGVEHSVPVEPGESALDAIRRAGVQVPFSCQSGVCGSCRARLEQGSVHMRANMALDEREVRSGAVLACQSVATSDALTLVFEP